MSHAGELATHRLPRARGAPHSSPQGSTTMTYPALPSSISTSPRTLFRLLAEFGGVRFGAVVVDHHHTVRTDATIEIRRHCTSPSRSPCP